MNSLLRSTTPYTEVTVWTFWIAYQFCIPEHISIGVTHLITQLRYFTARDQLILELLPPGLWIFADATRGVTQLSAEIVHQSATILSLIHI